MCSEYDEHSKLDKLDTIHEGACMAINELENLHFDN